MIQAYQLEIFVFLGIMSTEGTQGVLLQRRQVELSTGFNPRISPTVIIRIYTGCHRRNGPNFGRVSLMLNYTDITQNTYIQSWTITEIMARKSVDILHFRVLYVYSCVAYWPWDPDGTSSAQRDKTAFHYCRYVQCLVTLRTTQI